MENKNLEVVFLQLAKPNCTLEAFAIMIKFFCDDCKRKRVEVKTQ